MIVLACLFCSGPALAQPSPEPPVADPGRIAAALGAVPAGSMLRVQTGGAQRFLGPWNGVAEGALFIGQHRIELDRVEAVWLRGRATRRGATIGALSGGGAGLMFSAFFGLLVGSVGASAGEVTSLVVGGTLLGAAGGGAVGAAVGAARPEWRRLYPATGVVVQEPSSVREVVLLPEHAEGRGQRRRFAALEGAIGHGRSDEDGGTSGGPGARIALLSEYGTPGGAGRISAFAAFGPEIGYHALGSTGPRAAPRYTTACLPDGPCETRVDTVAVRRRYGIADAGGVLRIGVSAGAVEPYGVVGAGLHVRRIASTALDQPAAEPGYTASQYIAGYSVGGGAQFRTGVLPIELGIEARWRSNALKGQSDGIDEVFGYWTLAATAKRGW